MPDVTVDNPTVQIDLKGGSKTSVPSGERWKVTVANNANNGATKVNGTKILSGGSGIGTAAIRIDLFGGDTINDAGGGTVIRGYRVDP